MFGVVWEIKLHFSLLLAICCGISLLISLDNSSSCLFALASTSLIILDFIMSGTYHLLAHWRSLPLTLIMIVSCIINGYFWARGTSMSYPSQISLAMCIFCIALITLCILALLPIPTLSLLKGPFKRIGTHSFRILATLPDTAQLYRGEESYELTVQCWFPISHELYLLDKIRKIFGLPLHSYLWTSGHPDYQKDEISKLMSYTAENSGLPKLLFRHMSLAQSNAEFIPDMTSVSFDDMHERFPIVVYSHGMYSWRQLSSTTFEMLASNGFAVFSVDHRPSAMMARPHPMQNESDAVSFDYLLPNHIRPGSAEERAHYIGGIDRRSREIMALIDHMVNEPKVASTFNLDTSKIHVFGHSFGGGTCASVACRDDRITSCAMLDSWVYPLGDEERTRGSRCPLLMLSSEHWDIAKYQAPFRKDLATNTGSIGAKEGKQSTNNKCFAVTFKGTDHLNFCDMHLMASSTVLKMSKKLGPVDPFLFNDAMNHILLRFFIATGAYKTIEFAPGDNLTDTERLLRFLGMSSATGGLSSPRVSLEEGTRTYNALVQGEGTTESYSYPEQSQAESSIVIDTRDSETLANPTNRIADQGLQIRHSLKCFENIQKLPAKVEQCVVSSLADESSLTHCFDDTYFKMVQAGHLDMQ